MRDPRETRTVMFVAYPGCQVLDLAGPHEAFDGANRWAGRTVYQLRVVSPAGGLTASESGLSFASEPLPSVTDTVDTVLVVGGTGVHDARNDASLVSWIRQVAPQARRVGSVCTGTFLLAEAGLLHHRRVTTHWARAGRLADEFPDTVVDADQLHIHDGTIWTSAGVAAGIDLALSLIDDDLGAECAQTVARWLVMFLRRPGGQSQFAAPVWQEVPEHDGIRAAVQAVHEDPAADHSIAAMAQRASMSPRNFTRVFTRELGCSPGRYVEQVRVAVARRLLETTSSTTATIAAESGLGSSETLRRVFARSVGTSPGAYRRRFHHDPDALDPTTRRSAERASENLPIFERTAS